uniref:Uncharacterized protein n=1 Tax=Rhizophora mucronata TaxID=61149 RepID=A0A2P2P1L8_RHIMU
MSLPRTAMASACQQLALASFCVFVSEESYTVGKKKKEFSSRGGKRISMVAFQVIGGLVRLGFFMLNGLKWATRYIIGPATMFYIFSTIYKIYNKLFSLFLKTENGAREVGVKFSV